MSRAVKGIFRRFSVQPMDGPDRARNTALAIAFCLAHPQWQLRLQTHKMTGCSNV